MTDRAIRGWLSIAAVLSAACLVAAAERSYPVDCWPDRLVECAASELGEDLPNLLGDELEEVGDELRFAGELLPQVGVLGRDPDRAGVEMADPHHHATHHHQRCGREPELLRTEQRGDHHVATGLELAVDLDDDAIPEVIQEKGLLGLGQPDLPGRAGMLDRCLG